jgi:hypothetical protein
MNGYNFDCVNIGYPDQTRHLKMLIIKQDVKEVCIKVEYIHKKSGRHWLA